MLNTFDILKATSGDGEYLSFLIAINDRDNKKVTKNLKISVFLLLNFYLFQEHKIHLN